MGAGAFLLNDDTGSRGRSRGGKWSRGFLAKRRCPWLAQRTASNPLPQPVRPVRSHHPTRSFRKSPHRRHPLRRRPTMRRPPSRVPQNARRPP